MDDKEMAKRILALLMRAVENLDQENESEDEETQERDPLLDDLKAVAFEALLLNPGCEQSDWAHILVEQYGTEVVDAYGNNPFEVYEDLANLWESPYYDRNSGLEYTFEEWAQALCTEQSVQMYHDLTEARKT